MTRYFLVLAPRSEIAHRAKTHIDGDATYCGRRMRAGWSWFVGLRRLDSRKCKRCYA
jgi:hypothetical protein